jgi:putative FmdB family regulatory protein
MPTYDYECDACGHTWEVFQNITADPITKCPGCNKKKARRLFGTGAALMFKGSGFYETDYRSESYKKSAKADQPGGDGKPAGSESGSDKSATSADTGSGKSETKAEPKSDTKSTHQSDSAAKKSGRKPKPD